MLLVVVSLVGGDEVSMRRRMAWDPPVLLPFFWLSDDCARDASEEQPVSAALKEACVLGRADHAEWCGRSVRASKLEASEESASSVLDLRQLLKTASIAPSTVVVGHDWWLYDYRRATKWACVTQDEQQWLAESQEDRFTKKQQRRVVDEIDDPRRNDRHRKTTADAAKMSAMILSQILLRPHDDIRREVLDFEEKLFFRTSSNETNESSFVSRRGDYVAIHLLDLEGACVFRHLKNGGARRQRFKPEEIVADFRSPKTNIGVDAFVGNHVCRMSDDYIKANLALLPKNLPIVLAHDERNWDRATDIQATFNALSYHHHDLEVHVNLQLLLRATYFIGNPISALSVNVNAMRCIANHQQPNSNLPCDYKLQHIAD